MLGLDALASAAYGPEAALTILLAVGAGATHYIGPISAVIILLLVVYLSYRQTISAYPNGGGAYTVASENLGQLPALYAASALILDYVLNVAVAISAGVGAIISAAPVLQPYTLALCLAILLLLTVVNLRGVREAGLLFMLPTYAFLLTLGVTIALGIFKTLASGGHPLPVVVPHHPSVRATVSTFGLSGAWLLVRSFASGCTAMTGVEAVSNGVPLFKEPVVKKAEHTLTAIIASLAVLLAGIAFLAQAYGVTATVPGVPGYRSIVSQIVAAVAGDGVFYYVTIAAMFTVLCLSANTSFAGFPRLCRVLALDEFLPAEFAHPGRRLVYSVGVVILAVLAGALLVVFGGITDRLIPLFAVGAFLTFTLSQAGMVAHWKRHGGSGSARARALNFIGALATGATLIVVVASKFTEGAWMTVVIIPSLVLFFKWVRGHEERIDKETDVSGPLQLEHPPPPIVIVPVKRLNRVARKALRLAVSISSHVQVVQIFAEDLQMEDLRRDWREVVECPLRDAGFIPPELVLIRSPYREFFGPLLDHVRDVAVANPHRYVAVVVPELVDRRWYELVLASHRATLLKGLLLLRGGPRVLVINTPWYLRGEGIDGNNLEEGAGTHGNAALRAPAL